MFTEVDKKTISKAASSCDVISHVSRVHGIFHFDFEVHRDQLLSNLVRLSNRYHCSLFEEGH